MSKYNPFTPNSPVHKGMFVGRSAELKALDKALLQTQNGNPAHLLLLGERGMGKTSLLNVAQYFANGELSWDDQKYNFVTVRMSLNENICLADFAINLKNAIKREILSENPDLAWFDVLWGFITRFEGAGVSYRKEESKSNDAQIIQDLSYSLVDTIKRLRTGALQKKKDGLVFLIDEADKASSELHLGSFLKDLSETLASKEQNHILFILTGLPNLREVLLASHESSLRLFQELNLKTLSREETEEVIQKGLNDSKEKSGIETKIEPDAVQNVYDYSEGYPHYIQQICYSFFDIDTDNNITSVDVKTGFFDDQGALDQIGTRYYHKLFYKDITTEIQREVLKIMSSKWNNWIKREDIKKAFSGTDQNLDNSLRSLREKGIIIPRDGLKGQYRLQWGSFAFWISTRNEKNSKQRT